MINQDIFLSIPLSILYVVFCYKSCSYCNKDHDSVLNILFLIALLTILLAKLASEHINISKSIKYASIAGSISLISYSIYEWDNLNEDTKLCMIGTSLLTLIIYCVLKK